jgi:hypothetical protein
MTYALERKAIETYLQTSWGSTTPIGFDGHDFEPSFNSIRLSIQNGQVLQGICHFPSSFCLRSSVYKLAAVVDKTRTFLM